MTSRDCCFEIQTWFALGFQFDKVNFSLVSFINVTNMASIEGDSGDVPSVAVSMITIIINTISCPFTVVLNVLVIKAVKTTPRLRTNSNILLSCLAVSDVLTGLFCQPFFILWQIFLLLGLSNGEILQNCYQVSVVVFQTASYLHLMLVTFERLVAIKFTMKYSNIITDDNMRRAVLVVWIIAFINGVLRGMEMVKVAGSLAGLLTLSCILFLAFSYCIMYRETRRQQEKIKNQQLPQEEKERFTKENKALKTTLFVVGAVVIFLLPLSFCLTVVASGIYNATICQINKLLVVTCAMLNSLVNPLIYCWRQNEMRKVMFGIRNQVVHPEIQWRRGM